MPLIFLLFILPRVLLSQETIWVSADKIKGDGQQASATSYIISKEKLAQSSGLTFFELMRTVPGLTINQNGGEGKVTQIKIRGMENRHTLVLLDGMELNDPSLLDRSADLSTIDLNSLERIEVIKGPQTVLYGSDAIGGVILLSSKKFTENKNTLIVGAGSFHDQKAQLFHAKELSKKANYSLGFSQSASEGFSSFNNQNGGAYEADGYHRYSLLGKFHYELSQNHLLDAGALVKGLKSETDDSTGDSEKNFSESDNWMSSVKLTSYLGEISESLLEVQASEFDRFDLYTNGTFKSDNRGALLKLNYQNNIFWNQIFTSSIGFEGEKEKMYSKSGAIDKENDNYALFLQQKLDYNNFFATAGARLDRHDVFEDFTSVKASLGYEQETFWIKPSYSTGHKAPSLYQLYDSFSGNKNLKPEKAYSYEINSGLILVDACRFEHSYFNGQFEDKIDALAPSYVYFNGSKNKVYGHEFSLNLSTIPNLNLGLSSTWQKSFDYTDQKTVNKVPERIHNLDLTYKMSESWLFAYNFFYKAHRREGLHRHPSYSLHQLSTEFKQKSYSVSLMLKNLLDKKYEESRNYDTAGRSYFTSLKVDF
jgi:vitamin B12 transporter